MRKVLTRETLAANRDNSMWRYRALMPVADTTDVSRFLRIGWSPLYESKKLRDELAAAKQAKEDAEGRLSRISGCPLTQTQAGPEGAEELV